MCENKHKTVLQFFWVRPKDIFPASAESLFYSHVSHLSMVLFDTTFTYGHLEQVQYKTLSLFDMTEWHMD